MNVFHIRFIIGRKLQSQIHNTHKLRQVGILWKQLLHHFPGLQHNAF